MSGPNRNRINRPDEAANSACSENRLDPLRCVVASGMVLMAASSAYAGGPAVSEVNGKFSVEGGAAGSDSRGGSGLGVAEGSFTAPLSYSFGIQLDGAVATAYRDFFAAGAVQLFWRDPQVGLLGTFASVGGGQGNTVSWYGGQAEYFAGMVTLGAHVGYQVGYDNTAANGTFAIGRLTYYPIPNLALTVGGGTIDNRGFGRVALEYQPELYGRHSTSFFVNGAVGSDDAYAVTAGVRLYFGSEKTLIRRHREDDPLSIVGPGVGGGNGGSGGLFGTGGNGGNGGAGYVNPWATSRR